MLRVQDLADFLELPASDLDRAEAIRQGLIDLWETQTDLLQDARTDHVEVVSLIYPRMTRIYLGLSPITSITKVEVSSDGGTWSEVEASGYALVGPRELLRMGTTWPSYVRVTASGGWADGDEPAEVREACFTQARFALEREAPGIIAISSKGVDKATTAHLAPGLHPRFKLAASNRRRVC